MDGWIIRSYGWMDPPSVWMDGWIVHPYGWMSRLSAQPKPSTPCHTGTGGYKQCRSAGTVLPAGRWKRKGKRKRQRKKRGSGRKGHELVCVFELVVTFSCGKKLHTIYIYIIPWPDIISLHVQDDIMCNDGERERERERESERESIPVLPFSHLLQYLTYGIQRQWFTNCVSELWKLILCALPFVYQRCLGYFHRDKCCLKHCAVGSSRKVWLPLVGSTFICVGVYLNIAITMLIKLTIYIYIRKHLYIHKGKPALQPTIYPCKPLVCATSHCSIPHTDCITHLT